MMSSPETLRQKAADAAFFQDWSEWANLDGLPPPPRTSGGHIIRTNDWQRYNRYGMDLRLRVPWMGGPAFEIMIPSQTPLVDLIKRVPGARQLPGINGMHHVSNQRMQTTWFVPAHEWQALRRILPALKRATSNYVTGRL